MKLAFSLVLFMLIQHVLSAPSNLSPTEPPNPVRHRRTGLLSSAPGMNNHNPRNQGQLSPHIPAGPVQFDGIYAPRPRRFTGYHVGQLQRQVAHGCSASECSHTEFTHGGFGQHLTSTHFTASSNQSKKFNNFCVAVWWLGIPLDSTCKTCHEEVQSNHAALIDHAATMHAIEEVHPSQL